MVNLQLEDAREKKSQFGFIMTEAFHTEDCGLSLICRCCRGPVCEQRLTKADRMRMQRELWAHEDRRHRYGSSTRHIKPYMRKLFSCVVSGMVARAIRLF
jgi:hypothetical protein